MADFSPSGIADLPRTTADSLRHGDPQVLGFLKEWIQDGDRINRADPSYEGIGKAQEYLVGEQLKDEIRSLKYLPSVVLNEMRKATQAHVSALTDLKPLAGWKAASEWQTQADLLNKYLLYEWVTYMLDVDLGDVIKYALVAGTGDLVVDWDPHCDGGATEFSARDPRDTLALRPGNKRSIQLWDGVCLREIHTINALKGVYPTFANYLRPAGDAILGTVLGRFRSMLSKFLTPADPLDHLGATAAAGARRPKSGDAVLYRAFLKDRTKNLTDKPIPMGQPGTNWAYVVKPGEPLYPRGRLIVATDYLILFDGPNPYWHGQFPVSRLKLWSVPWQFLGVPLFNDLMPVQEAINDTMNDVRLGMRKWMDPNIQYNRNAISEGSMRTFDARRPGSRIKVNPGFGEPIKYEEGPNPQILAQGIALWEKLTQKFESLSGTANLQALLQLRQVPSADTIEKYFEALTPEIRYEARMIEAFLRDVSEQIKGNYFQFLDKFKRVQILGVGGQALADFDYDPNMLVPAKVVGEPGYVQELDAKLTTRDQRAQWFRKQFTFIVAPNSILSINATEKKMMNLQLSRQGYMDMWTLLESLEVPNVGGPPPIPLPPLEPPPPEILQMIALQAMATPEQATLSAAGQMPLPQVQDPATGRTYMAGPQGQILEVRVPVTITERLQAQMLMGLGMAASPAGRKASGQEAPQMESKTDSSGGERQTVTESPK